MHQPAQVRLREVAPRDGFQSLDMFVPTPEKMEIIGLVRAAGIVEIEAASFVSPRVMPQMRDAAEVMAAVPRNGAVYTALVPNLTGAGNALDAGADQLVVVVSASEAHNRRNVHRSIDESLAEVAPILVLASERGIPVIGAMAVSLGCPYQGEVPLGDVLRIAEVYVQNGASALMLSDTAGMASPTRVARLVRRTREHFGDLRLILHLHNNRGVAMANLLAGLDAGVAEFDTALGGIGGCPFVPRAAGNLATEDVAFMLQDMGVDTGIDLDRLIRAACRLEEILGFTLPGQVMKSGPRR